MFHFNAYDTKLSLTIWISRWMRICFFGRFYCPDFSQINR